MAVESQIGEVILRKIVRELLVYAQLPRESPTQMWGGAGNGSLCDVCARPISQSDAEYELVFHPPHDSSLRLHLCCYEAWEVERQNP